MTTVATAGQAPARTLPLLYLGAAHISLGLACVFAGIWPGSVAGFFYHSWMVSLVHLVTLGWITFSILVAIYVFAPVALLMEMPAAGLYLESARLVSAGAWSLFAGVAVAAIDNVLMLM